MRLRFGRRNDPLMSLLNEVNFLCNVVCLITSLNLCCFLFNRRRCFTVTNHSVERHKEHHQYVSALANVILPCLTMKWVHISWIFNFKCWTCCMQLILWLKTFPLHIYGCCLNYESVDEFSLAKSSNKNFFYFLKS